MQLVNRGEPVTVVQALLGHASLSSTQIYVREPSGIASDGRVCAGRLAGRFRNSRGPLAADAA